jgi:Fe-S-cluster formation regulator IscX/YfhJ
LGDISIRETIPDKKSWFNIKRFKIGSTDFEKPEKSLDSKSLTQESYGSLVDPKSFRFAEMTKIVSKYSDLTDVYNESDDTKINQYFGKKSWLNDLPNVVNLTSIPSSILIRWIA